MIHKIESPLFVMLPRKTTKDKRISLNMNTYRNLHHRTNNDAKKMYHKLMRYNLEGLKINTPVEITYKVFKGSTTRKCFENIRILCYSLTDSLQKVLQKSTETNKRCYKSNDGCNKTYKK